TAISLKQMVGQDVRPTSQRSFTKYIYFVSSGILSTVWYVHPEYFTRSTTYYLILTKFIKAGCFVRRKAIFRKKFVRKSSLSCLTFKKNTHEIFRHSLRNNAGHR